MREAFSSTVNFWLYPGSLLGVLFIQWFFLVRDIVLNISRSVVWLWTRFLNFAVVILSIVWHYQLCPFIKHHLNVFCRVIFIFFFF